MKYRAEIDGLRALAVLPVIFFHAGFEPFSGGYIGVDVFFVISGYLITTILINEMQQGQFSLVSFYERRARRILPALFVVVICSIPFAWVLLTPSEMKDFSQSLLGVATFSSNILFWLESGYFDTAAELKPMLHTWSLAVEEQFYILFPLFLMLLWRVKSASRVLIIVLFVILSLVLAQWASFNKPSAAFFLLITRAWELLLGVLCAFYLVSNKSINRKLAEFLSCIGIFLILVAIFTFNKNTLTPSVYTLLPTLGAVLIVLFANQTLYVRSLLGVKPLVGVGLISYSAYLWHQPVLVFARYTKAEALSNVFYTGLILITLLLAYLTWRFIETPFRNKAKVSKRSILLSSSTALIALFVFGLLGHVSDGYRKARENNLVVVNASLIEKAILERREGIKAGECHFHYRELIPIKKFIDNWNCDSQDDDLPDSNVLVFGDSHAADKAMAIRKNGFGVIHLSGAGCQISPEYISAENTFCFDLFSKIETIINDYPVSAVFVANRFPEDEISRNYIASILDYWRGWEKPIFLFSPMTDHQLQMIEYKRLGMTTVAPDFSRENTFFDVLETLDIPSNISLIKTSDLWCGQPGEDKTCAVVDESMMTLMTGRDHLSVNGATFIGKQIIKHSLLEKYFE